MSGKENRFSGLLDAKRGQEENPSKSVEEEIQEAVNIKEEMPPQKEKKGKNSNPDYVQISAYIRKDTRLNAKRLLLGKENDLSDLIENLVSEWVDYQSKNPST
jgi:hypothetical protein